MGSQSMTSDDYFLQPSQYSCNKLLQEHPITPSISQEKQYQRENPHGDFPSLSSNPALHLIASADKQLTPVRPEGKAQKDGGAVKLFGVDVQERAAMVCLKERNSINPSLTKELSEDNQSWAILNINERTDEESGCSSALDGGQGPRWAPLVHPPAQAQPPA
eukprot:c7322_g1_i1 orf=1-483(-)